MGCYLLGWRFLSKGFQKAAGTFGTPGCLFNASLFDPFFLADSVVSGVETTGVLYVLFCLVGFCAFLCVFFGGVGVETKGIRCLMLLNSVLFGVIKRYTV